MINTFYRWLAGAIIAAPTPLLAQQKAPIAQYWMSVDTSAGMNIPGMGGMGAMGGLAGMMMGRQAQGGRTIRLDLGSQRSASAPSAAHEIPAVMNMGPSLPLETPQSARREPAERGELPKGRWLIYWGCGDSVRPGQPVVVDLASLAQGQLPAGFTSRRAGSGAPPSGRTSGYWPNQQQPKPVPDDASLVGEHTIRGNYTPDIRFTLTPGQDFMDRVALTSAPGSGGGATLRWNALSNATGYSAVTMGSEGNDTIFWSSSDVQTWGWELMDWIAPAEVTRLIREKVVLSPQITECTVPAEIVKKSGTPMAMFIGYGPEANFAFPARPKDPDWYVKVRFKSTASAMLEDGESRSRSQRAGQPSQPSAEPASGQAPSAPSAVQEGVNILRGIFGR